MKFIHAADVHLDSPLRGLEEYEGAPVTEIRRTPRGALENLVALAIDQKVDFLLIAGDLYDGDWKDFSTGLFFVSQMQRLRQAEIPVIVICGNHDAANKMTKTLPLPDNVELLSHARPETAPSKRLHELGVAVHGRSFGKMAETDNLALAYPVKSRGMFNIGLLHTSLTGAEGHEPYAPCTIDELRRKEYDYWALGHVHTREVRHSDPPIVFCGNLQGRHIRESGPKGCYLVTVDDRQHCDLEFRELDVFRWDTCRVFVDDAQSVDDVLELFAAELSSLSARHADLPLAVRVELCGRSRAHAALVADAPAIAAQLRASAIDASDGRAWIEKVKFRTRPLGEATSLHEGNGPSPLAEMHRYLSELRGDDSQLADLSAELADLFKKLPGELFQGDDAFQVADAAWMRDCLDEVESLLASRMSGVNS